MFGVRPAVAHTHDVAGRAALASSRELQGLLQQSLSSRALLYTGESQTFTSGDELTHGQTGEVVGLPPSDQPTFGKGVSVKFPGHKNSTNLYLTSLRRAP